MSGSRGFYAAARIAPSTMGTDPASADHWGDGAGEATMRLLCDAMLAGLARWLRVAGHDTTLRSSGMTDRALLDLAAAEERILITRNRSLAVKADGLVQVLLLMAESPDEQARALYEQLGIDWGFVPFSRCLVDNTPLVEASPEDLELIPKRSRALPGPFLRCATCGRIYWPGSHVRRMTARLEQWQDQARRQAVDL